MDNMFLLSKINFSSFLISFINFFLYRNYILSKQQFLPQNLYQEKIFQYFLMPFKNEINYFLQPITDCLWYREEFCVSSKRIPSIVYLFTMTVIPHQGHNNVTITARYRYSLLMIPRNTLARFVDDSLFGFCLFSLFPSMSLH